MPNTAAWGKGDTSARSGVTIGPPPMPRRPDARPAVSPMAASFYAESKRVDNRRIKADLGVRLRYPDYRAGLAALLAQER